MQQPNYYNNIDLNDPKVQQIMQFLMNQMKMNQYSNPMQQMPMSNQMMNNIYMNPMMYNMYMNYMNNNNNMKMMNNVGGNVQNPMNMMNNNFQNPMYMNTMNNNIQNPTNVNMMNNNNFGVNSQNSNQMNFNNNNNNQMIFNNNNNNQMNFNNNKINDQSNNQSNKNNLEEILPREDKTLFAGDANVFNQGDNIINVALNASSGLKVIVPISNSCTIEELIKKYAQRAAIPDDALGTKIIFLFNGEKLEINSQKKLSEIFKSGCVITVIDQGGIIGA